MFPIFCKRSPLPSIYIPIPGETCSGCHSPIIKTGVDCRCAGWKIGDWVLEILLIVIFVCVKNDRAEGWAGRLSRFRGKGWFGGIGYNRTGDWRIGGCYSRGTCGGERIGWQLGESSVGAIAVMVENISAETAVAVASGVCGRTMKLHANAGRLKITIQKIIPCFS